MIVNSACRIIPTRHNRRQSLHFIYSLWQVEYVSRLSVLVSGISAADSWKARGWNHLQFAVLHIGYLGAMKSRLFSSGASRVGCFRVAWEWLPFVQSNLGLQL